MTPTILLIVVALALALFYLVRRGGGGMAHKLLSLRAMDAVVNAYRSGDYETALQKCGALKKGSSRTAEYCFLRGGMLGELGRLTEAEASLREGLPLENDPRSIAVVYERLGSTLLDQGRFADAIACFEDSIRAYPDRAGGHRGIAKTWLRQNREIPEALDRARRAAEIDRNVPPLDAELHKLDLAEDLAVLAWAVAASSGDVSEVERLVGEALPLCDSKTKPIAAELHYHAGRAYSTLRMAEKSAYHFSQASALDPQGSFGRLAREQNLKAGN